MSNSKENIGKLHYDMMRRCYSPKCIMYKDYGAKGITVCPEWHDRNVFRQWALENGYVKGLKIERIDGSKGYSPDNCQLAKKTISKNTRTRAIRNHRKSMKEMAGITEPYGHSRIYHIYHGMLQRCYNKDDYHYKEYGARPLRRAIQNLVEDEIADGILSEKIKPEIAAKLVAKEDKIYIEN